jgi:hypothetical protein
MLIAVPMDCATHSWRHYILNVMQMLIWYKRDELPLCKKHLIPSSKRDKIPVRDRT